MKTTICCVAGRSAGHIIPCLTRAQQIAEHEKDARFIFFTTQTELDKKVLKGISSINNHITLSMEGLPGKQWIRYPFFLLKCFTSFIKSFYWLLKERPKVIISTGGYISTPVCIAGYLLNIRIELFELNAIPGKATRWLAPFCSNLYVCFSQTQQFFKNRTAIVTPYPIRFSSKKNILQREALEMLHLKTFKKTILILGGSQGSEFINTTIKKIFTEFPQLKKSFQIIHQTGAQQINEMKRFYKKQTIDAAVFDYHAHPDELYPAADLVVCRAGAGTLFETLYFKKRCITIPLETSSTCHQLDNAQAFEHDHPTLITVLRQNELSKTIEPLATALQSLMAST